MYKGAVHLETIPTMSRNYQEPYKQHGHTRSNEVWYTPDGERPIPSPTMTPSSVMQYPFPSSNSSYADHAVLTTYPAVHSGAPPLPPTATYYTYPAPPVYERSSTAPSMMTQQMYSPIHVVQSEPQPQPQAQPQPQPQAQPQPQQYHYSLSPQQQIQLSPVPIQVQSFPQTGVEYPTLYQLQTIPQYPQILEGQPYQIQIEFPRYVRGQKCPRCGRHIVNDIARHMRIHEPVSRFKCIYPRQQCSHRSGYFNRRYDFHKHLLHSHFKFDDPDVKKLVSVNDKMKYIGACKCGMKMTGREFLNNHIMIKDAQGKYLCPDLREKWNRFGGTPINTPTMDAGNQQQFGMMHPNSI